MENFILSVRHVIRRMPAWLQPMSEAKSGWNKSNPSYEEYYAMEIPVGTPSPTAAGWVFPALFRVGETWVLLTESGLKKNYCGARLKQESNGGKYEIGFPQEQESIFGGPVYPESTTPWSTPWRIIAVGNLATLVESTLGTDSAGDWNTTPYHPRSKLLNAEDRNKEFAILREMNIAGVKVDFFGGDGQSVISYYHDILIDASRHQLLVNFHGATIPRGWHRTYPNLMTMESIKGFEFITFEQQNADVAPAHCALLPFVRNVFDSMDFTPMSLYTIPNITRRTTAAFELALPVLFLSGIQHIAETPEGMSHVPDRKGVLTGVPTDWADSRFLAGFPGKYAVIARKKDDRWFVSGINGSDSDLPLTLDLTFISANDGILITDGTGSSAFEKKEVSLRESSSLEIKMIARGGFVIKF